MPECPPAGESCQSCRISLISYWSGPTTSFPFLLSWPWMKVYLLTSAHFSFSVWTNVVSSSSLSQLFIISSNKSVFIVKSVIAVKLIRESLDRASVALFSFPFLYSISKLNYISLVIHLSWVPVCNFCSNRNLRAFWYVLTMKDLHIRYYDHLFIANNKANSFFHKQLEYDVFWRVPCWGMQ